MSADTPRERSYGQDGLGVLDRFGVWLSRRPVEAVVKRYESPSVLDLGCGYDAKLLTALSPLISSGVGVDVRVREARRADPKLTFVESTIEAALATFAAESFDVILLISVLEHLWQPTEVLVRCRGLLHPGGSLVINVPNWKGKWALELAAFRLGLAPAAEMDDHKMYYDKRDLWPLLVQAGFRPSRIRMRYHKFGLNLFAVARVP